MLRVAKKKVRCLEMRRLRKREKRESAMRKFRIKGKARAIEPGTLCVFDGGCVKIGHKGLGKTCHLAKQT